MGMSLSKLWEIVKERETWPAAVHEVAKSQKRFSGWTTTTSKYKEIRVYKASTGREEKHSLEQQHSIHTEAGKGEEDEVGP